MVIDIRGASPMWNTLNEANIMKNAIIRLNLYIMKKAECNFKEVSKTLKPVLHVHLKPCKNFGAKFGITPR